MYCHVHVCTVDVDFQIIHASITYCKARTVGIYQYTYGLHE